MLAVVTVATAFTDQMAEFHHVAVPIATSVMFAAWALELGNVGWPRVLLILGVVVPNLWLTAIGHVSANELFVILMVAWVGVVGTRLENGLAIALALSMVALGIALDFVFGSVNWSAWTSWLVGIVLVWLMALVLSREEQIVEQRERLRAEAEARSNELASLVTVSRSVASTLEMQPLLDAILDALGKVVDYDGAVIFTLELRLDILPGVVVMAIDDDGVGFTPEVDGNGGFGLNGMRQRIEGVGGTLRIDSSPGNGTRIQVEVPR